MKLSFEQFLYVHPLPSGIILYLCLTGTSPWLKADWVADHNYCAFKKYQVRFVTTLISFKFVTFGIILETRNNENTGKFQEVHSSFPSSVPKNI